MDHLCYLCLVFFMLSHLFIAALWSTAGKGLTSWLLFGMFNCVFVTFQRGFLCQVWYLIVLIPDLCRLSYFYNLGQTNKKVIFFFLYRGADDLLPVLCYVVAQCKMPQIVSECQAMERFIHEG